MNAKPQLTLNSIVTRNQDVPFSSLDGHIVALNIANGSYHSIDETGAHIWALIESARPVTDICAAMMEKFDVDSAQCEQDVLLFLHSLADRDLLTLADAS